MRRANGTTPRPEGPLWAFVAALVLSPAVVLVLYLEIAASVDRAYRSAQLIAPSISAVIGYSLLGLAGPAVAGLVAAVLGNRRRPLPLAMTTVALSAELAAVVCGAPSAFWLLHAGVT